ncbi:hypothetical protein B0H14DRAFT_3163298 [Mycena olivaceomarginata]|nr:hypothetical protein B0H14DRAFT_3163298 [Mycena olivaceomarginata]
MPENGDVKTSSLFPPSSPALSSRHGASLLSLTSEVIPQTNPLPSSQHGIPHPAPSCARTSCRRVNCFRFSTEWRYDYWHADLAFGVHTALEDIERQLALPEFRSLGNTFPEDFERSSTVSTTTDGPESSPLFAYLT